MSDIVEWVQCKNCGRRHRWQAETAGTNIACDCGDRVFMPEVDIAGEQTDPDATIIETVDSPTAVAPGSEDDLDSTVFGKASSASRNYYAKGVFGLDPFGEVILFFIFAIVGFSLLVHAVVVQTIWYIVLTVLFTPWAFYKFNLKRKKWQGNRSLSRAFQETIDAGD